MERTGLDARRYTIRLATGALVTGPVQGSGGVIGSGEHNLARLQTQTRRANAGEPLGIYEPRPGHVVMYPHYSAHDTGEPVEVDLRGAEVIA